VEPLLETQISLWRDYLRRHQAIHSPEVAELGAWIVVVVFPPLFGFR
jgi:hypothetical protein